ncbi:MAG: hypothetical protein Q7S40_20670, partial [Opitutaceae bacterium]|nr:hypothetical protein [Opitutaceae bacterium]
MADAGGHLMKDQGPGTRDQGLSIRRVSVRRFDAWAWRSLVFGLWSLVSIPSVHAQSSAPQTVRFTVFAARPITDVTFTPRANAAAQKLTFYPTARSPRYEYRGVMPLHFLDT